LTLLIFRTGPFCGARKKTAQKDGVNKLKSALIKKTRLESPLVSDI
jgi:hypothetical protein